MKMCVLHVKHVDIIYSFIYSNLQLISVNLQ